MATQGMCRIYSVLNSTDLWVGSIELAAKSELSRGRSTNLAKQLMDSGAVDVRVIDRMRYFKLSDDNESNQTIIDIKETMRILNHDR